MFYTYSINIFLFSVKIGAKNYLIDITPVPSVPGKPSSTNIEFRIGFIFSRSVLQPSAPNSGTGNGSHLGIFTG